MRATFIRNIEGWQGEARLYRFPLPIRYVQGKYRRRHRHKSPYMGFSVRQRGAVTRYFVISRINLRENFKRDMGDRYDDFIKKLGHDLYAYDPERVELYGYDPYGYEAMGFASDEHGHGLDWGGVVEGHGDRSNFDPMVEQLEEYASESVASMWWHPRPGASETRRLRLKKLRRKYL